ncbi:unnamed protein product [Caenorhabditis angaria]|uniref:DUF1248 domain-containing protein n=1 Tax=Caenorhabditis angaria TaxID=860376 RepID=A0A9P1INW4_9PELO|nr:unnamed protein product [Caenorhabditis angaria]
MEFETLINPPESVFEQIVYWTAKTEDWVVQLTDYKYWSTSFDKFWLFTVVEKGTTNLVASLSLARWDVPNDTPLYSIGLFYCLEKYRGQSIAKQLFQKAMDIVGDNNATLTGSVSMADKYASVFGFDKGPHFWHNLSSLKIEQLVLPEINNDQFVTKDWSEVDPELLNTYDLTICSRNRRKIQTDRFNFENSLTKVVFDLKTNQIVGYATIQKLVSKNALLAAPFYADNLEAAKVLLSDLLHQFPLLLSHKSISFMNPAVNQDTIRLLQTFAKTPEDVQSVRSFKSQFTKKFIQSPDEKVYSVTDSAHQFV